MYLEYTGVAQGFVATICVLLIIFACLTIRRSTCAWRSTQLDLNDTMETRVASKWRVVRAVTAVQLTYRPSSPYWYQYMLAKVSGRLRGKGV